MIKKTKTSNAKSIVKPNKISRSVISLTKEISTLVQGARDNVARNINNELLLTYWNIGKLIIEKEENDNIDEKSSRQLILELSKKLSLHIGKGFSRSNLFAMRKIFLFYKTVQTVSGQIPIELVQTLSGQIQNSRVIPVKSSKLAIKNKSKLILPDKKNRPYINTTLSLKLSWSHYCELLKVDDDLERSFYQQQAVIENWSIRELKRNKASALYQRLALSKDKKGILALAKKGHIIEKDIDIARDPYILEFLNIPDKEKYSEKQLEQKIIDNLQHFLLELGKGFAFVGRQHRVTLNNKHYYIDLVFYHRILKCFVLIDLKMDEVEHNDIGQMNMYLNYFETEMNVENDNKPIGIILATKKDAVMVEYATGGITNKIFVSKYQLYLPEKKLLQRKVEEILDKE